jgi:hypothetical protein
MTINITISDCLYSSVPTDLDCIDTDAFHECLELEYDLTLVKYQWVGIKFTSYYPLSVTLYCYHGSFPWLFDTTKVTVISITDLNEQSALSTVFNKCTLDRVQTIFEESNYFVTTVC